MNSLQDKVIIITGASSGIGKALAEEAMKHQMKVVMVARSLESMEIIAETNKWDAHNFLIIKADVTKEEDCKRIVEESVAKFNKIDILINNAGISMRALFEETEIAVLKKVMDVNFWGTVYCTSYALPYLLKSKGSVVGISSVAGYKGLPGRTGYAASKFAIRGFFESLRIENMKKGLHVLIACPGFTTSNIRKTALTSDGSQQAESPRDEEKMMSAETVAVRVLRAVAKRKPSLVLTTTGHLTVFLNKFVPGMVDKMVFNHMAKETDAPC